MAEYVVLENSIYETVWGKPFTSIPTKPMWAQKESISWRAHKGGQQKCLGPEPNWSHIVTSRKAKLNTPPGWRSAGAENKRERCLVAQAQRRSPLSGLPIGAIYNVQKIADKIAKLGLFSCGPTLVRWSNDPV